MQKNELGRGRGGGSGGGSEVYQGMGGEVGQAVEGREGRKRRTKMQLSVIIISISNFFLVPPCA